MSDLGKAFLSSAVQQRNVTKLLWATRIRGHLRGLQFLRDRSTRRAQDFAFGLPLRSRRKRLNLRPSGCESNLQIIDFVEPGNWYCERDKSEGQRSGGSKHGFCSQANSN